MSEYKNILCIRRRIMGVPHEEDGPTEHLGGVGFDAILGKLAPRPVDVDKDME
jgi:hypothetical protein